MKMRKEPPNTIKFENDSLLNHLESMMARAYQGSGYSLIEHGRAVGEVSAQIAEALDYSFVSSTGIDPIRLAGRFHDIGKVLVEEKVRLSKGRYSPREMAKMQHHPELGGQILGDLGADRFFVEAARYHHVWFSGGGYPKCFLKGESIPLIARIIAVADYFVARTEDRTYRLAEPVSVVWKDILERRGTWFDPSIVDAFTKTETFNRKLGTNPPRIVLRIQPPLRRSA